MTIDQALEARREDTSSDPNGGRETTAAWEKILRPELNELLREERELRDKLVSVCERRARIESLIDRIVHQEEIDKDQQPPIA